MVLDGTHKVLHLREHKVLLCSSSIVASSSLVLCVTNTESTVSGKCYNSPILRIGNYPGIGPFHSEEPEGLLHFA